MSETNQEPAPIRHFIALILGLGLSFVLTWILSTRLAAVFVGDVGDDFDAWQNDYADFIVYTIPLGYVAMLVSMCVVFEFFRSQRIANVWPGLFVITIVLAFYDADEKARQLQDASMPIPDSFYAFPVIGALIVMAGFYLYFRLRGRH